MIIKILTVRFTPFLVTSYFNPEIITIKRSKNSTYSGFEDGICIANLRKLFLSLFFLFARPLIMQYFLHFLLSTVISIDECLRFSRVPRKTSSSTKDPSILSWIAWTERLGIFAQKEQTQTEINRSSRMIYFTFFIYVNRLLYLPQIYCLRWLVCICHTRILAVANN